MNEQNKGVKRKRKMRKEKLQISKSELEKYDFITPDISDQGKLIVYLRAIENRTLEDIAKELGVSLSTVKRVTKDGRKDLENLKGIHFENQLKVYEATRKDRIEFLLKQRQSITKEFERRFKSEEEIKSLSTNDLLKLLNYSEDELKNINKVLIYTGRSGLPDLTEGMIEDETLEIDL